MTIWKRIAASPAGAPRRLSPLALGAILLAEGYASLGAEILALRRIAPWAGTSVDVTTVLLAAYLAALAGGYRRGGRLARDGDPRPRLAFRLTLAAALAAFWLSEPGILLAFGLPLPPLVQAAFYAVVGIAPVGWLLAECVLLAHACAPTGERSATAGRVFALSTVGNVAGALATTFLLLRFLGTAAAALVLCAGLLGAALLAFRRSVPLAACAAVAVFLAVDLWTEASVYVERNAYADYRIAERDGGRVLELNQQWASRHDAAGKGWPYVELLEATLCEAGETRVLVLGAGGMTIGQGAPCALEPVFLDLDPDLERIASDFLDVPEGAAGTFHARDARAFLRDDPGGWDAIVADAFTNWRSVPRHLLTVEFYGLARSRLRPGGSLYVNHVAHGDPAGERLFLTRVERTLRSVFAGCAMRETGLPPGTGWHAAATIPRGLLFRCLRSDLDGDRAVYSDALPRADLDRGLRLGAPD